MNLKLELVSRSLSGKFVSVLASPRFRRADQSVELLVERVLALAGRDPVELDELMATAEAKAFAIKAPDVADGDLLDAWDAVVETKPSHRMSDQEYSAFLRGEA